MHNNNNSLSVTRDTNVILKTVRGSERVGFLSVTGYDVVN